MRKGRFEKLVLKGVLWVGIILLIVFVVFIFGATWEVWHKQQKALSEKENAEEKYAEVVERHTMLEGELNRLNSDRGLEEEFPVAREGEEVFVLVDAPEAIAASEEVQPPSFWDVVRGWFK